VWEICSENISSRLVPSHKNSPPIKSELNLKLKFNDYVTTIRRRKYETQSLLCAFDGSKETIKICKSIDFTSHLTCVCIKINSFIITHLIELLGILYAFMGY
jgi:hypothetical protein